MAARAGPPSRADILRFIQDSPLPVGKRDIARAFKVSAADRPALRDMIRALEEEGVIARGKGRKMTPPDALPAVTMLDATGLDPEGALILRPLGWRADQGDPPLITLAASRRPHRGRSTPQTAAKPGDRVLARMERVGEKAYRARPIKVITERSFETLLGVYEDTPAGARLRPADKKTAESFFVPPEEAEKAASLGVKPGDVVQAERLPGGRKRLGPPPVRILERVGALSEPRAFSLMAIKRHGLRDRFGEEALAQADKAKPPALAAGDVDLRALPLVTIDGEDARDFDDAVWAAPRADGGFDLRIAIADVAWYVRPGDALDQEALARGNSAYFPDRVVPMLPEALSNGWCSLKPAEDRRCLTVAITLDAKGAKTAHRFERGLMRSAARLTYDQVQAAADGAPDDATAPLLSPVIQPLYAAYALLRARREQRGALEIDSVERKVAVNDDGRVAAITPRARHDSHRLIEEFMILANVCAAETLEARSEPCLYRVHDKPAPDKVEALGEILRGLDLPAPGVAAKAGAFNGILAQVAGRDEARMVNDLVLRCQAQAVYAPENIGHYGLALSRYAHFTSPIRRYADLCVHRGLIAALGLGAGGRTDAPDLARIGAQISGTERTAAMAERETVDRYVAAFLAERVGASFTGRISGVQRFGLFIALDETGADGLIPVQALGEEWWEHDAERHELTGRVSGCRYRLGDRVEVRLDSADPVSGRLGLTLMGGGGTGRAPKRRPVRPHPPLRLKRNRRYRAPCGEAKPPHRT